MPRSVSGWHVLADAAAVLLAFWLAHWLRFGSGLLAAPLGVIPLVQWLALALLSLPLWLLIASLHGLYYARLKQAFSAELTSVTHAAAEGLLATILLTFAIRGLPDSRLALLFAIALAWLLLAAYRALARRLRRRRPRAVVIGNSPLAQYLKRQLAGRANRFDLAAAYDNAAELAPDGIDAVFCDADQASALWKQLPDGPAPFAVHLLPEASAAGVGALSMATVEGVPTLTLKNAADLAMMRRAKRVVDIAGACFILLLTSPLWLLCILGIVLTMPGPLFFSHERVGLFGRVFNLLKFRSMVKDAQKQQVDLSGFDDKFKLEHDPRVTAFGRLMRRLSLDELPQLLNIIRGELSLVGPRPVVERELDKYGVWGSLLTTVPPGLTGLWQVSGRSDVSYQERIDYDLYYINNWSLGLDLLILLRTIPAVLSRKGAY